MDERVRIAALEYHLLPKPGKIAVTSTATVRRIVNVTALLSVEVVQPQQVR